MPRRTVASIIATTAALAGIMLTAPDPTIAARDSVGALRIVVVGDSVPFAAFCPGCTGFVDQYAHELEARLARPVEIANRSRDDSAGLLEIRTHVTRDASLRAEIAAADIVILSVGFNNALPDPTTGFGCRGSIGTTVEGYIAWALRAKTTCLRAGVVAYAKVYAGILATITKVRAGKPGLLVALNVYDANLGNSDFLAANVSRPKLQKLGRWIVRAYDRWNAMTCREAKGHGVACVDLYHAFNGPTGKLPLAGTGLLVDGAHPSQAGNDRIAALLAQLDTAAVIP